ncbi:glycosyl transferase, group 2 family protein [Rhodopirellula maiorica SM1]|uniref:Glycosyl transferase, group 2 family protein n=1 Tax=Rhodopirellula maiorica SM1 TaxID=1265738 RepID=M5REL2_9BACT|nr:glycosyl transferase, group 2 family protein [Rhodopirellula maiorica SM1]
MISVYNDEDFLAESLESILQQTFTDFELIVVNDGSTDSSAEILDRLAQRDSRIRVIDQSNQGLTRALINGCDLARGIYIARQDADDWSDRERLQKQFEVLESRRDLSFVSCWAEGITKEGQVLELVTRPVDSNVATEELRFQRQGPPAHGTVMFRKDIYQQVGGYRPQFYFSQDSDLWLRMAEKGPVLYLPETLYRYRRDAESLSSVRHDIQYEFGEFGQACHSVRASGGDESQLLAQAEELTSRVVAGAVDASTDQQRVAATQYLIGSQLAINGDPSAATYLWTVIRQRPWHLKAWVRLFQVWLNFGRPSSAG